MEPKVEENSLPEVHTRSFELADGQRFKSEAEEGHSLIVREVDEFLAKGIDSHALWTVAGEMGKVLADRIKMVKARWSEIIDPLNQAHKSATAGRKETLMPLEALHSKLASAHTAYRLDIERKEREEREKEIAAQRRLEEEARIAAEKVEAEARERRAKEEEARLRQAAAAEAEGDKERAEAILNTPQAEEAPPRAVQEPPEPLPGPVRTVQALPESTSKVTKRWKARILDPYAVLQVIIDDKDKPDETKRVSLNAIEFKQAWFNKRANTLHGLMNNFIPGTEAKIEASTSF